MSASNWAMCPKCEEKKLKSIATKRQSVAEKYGKWPQEKWEEERRATENWIASQSSVPSLREDWELGIHNGEFYVIYHGCCNKCDFEFHHKHERTVYPVPK